jgi:hypothetical protein
MPVETFEGTEQLDHVNALLHDRWFVATRIRLDGSDLVIPFASEAVSRAARATFDSSVVVHNVRSWNLDDPTQIEIYNFGRLSFDSASSRLTIEGNIPLTVEVHVDGPLTLSLNLPR